MNAQTITVTAKAVRILLNDTIPKTWAEYFDGEHKASAYSAALLVQEQKRCTFRAAMSAVEKAMPELFADYWEQRFSE